MTDKPWKLVLLLCGIFLTGAVTGSFVTVRVVQAIARRAAQPEQWGPNRLKMLEKRLDLTPEQVEKLRPVILRDMEDLTVIRQNGFREARRILERMNADISTELTPPQRVKFEELNREFRERMQRMRPGGPWGHGPNGGPPPSPPGRPPVKPGPAGETVAPVPAPSAPPPAQPTQPPGK